MKSPDLLLLLVLSVAVLCVGAFPVLAEAPATSKIAFSSWRGRNLDIYLMNPDGSEEVQLTHHRRRDAGPKWSPTGEQILFDSDQDGAPGDWDLYLMNADGSNVRRVFPKSAMCDVFSQNQQREVIRRGHRMENGLFTITVE